MSEQVQQTPSVPPKKKRNARRVKRTVKRIVKWVVWIAILAVAAFFGYRYYLDKTTENTAASTTSYVSASAMRGSLDKSIYGTGMIQAANQPTVTVQTDGKLAELRVDIGDEVKQGDILAVLQNDDRSP